MVRKMPSAFVVAFFLGGTTCWLLASACDGGSGIATEDQEISCDNGIDDDADGFTDCEDPHCAYSYACYESGCFDGIDNDGDGWTDCFDPDCADDPVCNTDCGNGIWEFPEACDGADLHGASCENLGFARGGTVKCTDECHYDVTECCGDGTIAGEEECDDGNQTHWDGCTNCQISEFQVNTSPTSWQAFPSVAAMADGSFVAVWRADGLDGDGLGVFGQWVDGAGRLVGPEFQVNTHTPGDQERPRVAAFSDNSFVVVWQSEGQDGDGWGVFARVFDGGGIPAGPETRVNSYTLHDQLSPAVATMAGGFVVVWQSEGQDGSSWGVFGQVFDSDGNPVSGEFGVNTTFLESQEAPEVSAAADWRFVTVWQSYGQDGDEWGVFGQRFDPGGPAGTEFQINTRTSDAQATPAVSMAPDGSFVVLWLEYPGPAYPSYGSGPWAQRYDSSGSPIAPVIQVAERSSYYGNEYPSVSTASDGRFVVAWYVDGRVPERDRAMCRLYDAGGSATTSEFQMDTTTDGRCYAYHPRVSAAPDGRFVAVWENDDIPGGGVAAQRFTASGERRGLNPF